MSTDYHDSPLWAVVGPTERKWESIEQRAVDEYEGHAMTNPPNEHYSHNFSDFDFVCYGCGQSVFSPKAKALCPTPDEVGKSRIRRREAAAPPPKADTGGVERALRDIKALAGRGGKFPDRYDDGWNAAVAQIISKLATLTAAPAPQGGVTREGIAITATPLLALLKKAANFVAANGEREDQALLNDLSAAAAALSQASPAREGLP